jgi:hypothetical protein
MISMEAFMDIFALKRKGLKVGWGLSPASWASTEQLKKYLESGTVPQYRKRNRKESILLPYLQLIEDWL